MKRALAERLKQENEAAAFHHPKAPPVIMPVSHSSVPQSHISHHNESHVHNLQAGGAVGRAQRSLNGIGLDQQHLSMALVTHDVSGGHPMMGVAPITAPSLSLAAPVTASPRVEEPISTGGEGTAVIPRRSLAPSQSAPSLRNQPQSAHDLASIKAAPQPAPPAGPSSSASRKKRPRSSRSVEPPLPLSLPQTPLQATPAERKGRTGAVGRGHKEEESNGSKRARAKEDPRRPSARTSGNTAAYRSQKHSNSDEEDASNAKNNGARIRSRRKRGGGRRDNDNDEENPEDSTTGFYLKHQNCALASELYAFRRRIYLLEREREFRRKECDEALEQVRTVATVWAGMEAAVAEGVSRNSNPKTEDIESIGGQSVHFDESGNDSLTPTCTGSGTEVEPVRSLLAAIKAVAGSRAESKPSPSIRKGKRVKKENDDDEDDSNGEDNAEEDDEELREEKGRLEEMDRLAADVADRAGRLRDGVLELLRVALERRGASAPSLSLSVPSLKECVARLESELSCAESKLEEMANARNEAVASERRVRRGLYRLASGRLKIDEVLKAVEKEDSGVSFTETLAMLDGINRRGRVGASTDAAGVVSTCDALSSPGLSGSAVGSGETAVNSEELSQLKKSLQDLNEISGVRDKKIEELLCERVELLKRINSLLLPNSKSSEPNLDEEVIRRSSLFTKTASKLTIVERRMRELEVESGKVKMKWAVMKGDLELAKKSSEETEEKHERRWNELLSMFSDADSDVVNVAKASSSPYGTEGVGEAKAAFSNVKKIADLEHKLRQALESVSRMETLRSTLVDAYKMIETLQSKLDDLKTKNAKFVAEKSAARASRDTESLCSSQGSSQSSLKRSFSGSAHDLEKLQRDYRRSRKEVAAAVQSKDQAKLKQERAEKERDTLMKSNARLLKHGSEKDDMNAKAVSSILQLKQRNEELVKENAIIKQKARAAEQLSLAARLASNAKDRVGEESLREKELLEETVQNLRRDCQLLLDEKECVLSQLANFKAQMLAVTKDLNIARERCDELAAESNKKEVEKKNMMESIAVAKKEAVESAKKAAVAIANSCSDGTVSSEFTMEQMTTQVKYLSSRINCPVCNTREKKCILLRCRHMFCRQCVDVNIKNRSRKCPACGQRFDMKDVSEIWL